MAADPFRGATLNFCQRRERGAGTQFDPNVVRAFREEFLGESSEAPLEAEAVVEA